MLHDQIHQESNFNNFKYAILWSMPCTSFYEARQEYYFIKHAKDAIF